MTKTVMQAFEAECQAEIAAQGQDEKLQGLARDFFKTSRPSTSTATTSPGWAGRSFNCPRT